MSAIAQALTDKDFLNAHPDDQKAYLGSIDPDFAKGSPEDQGAYLNHILAPHRLEVAKQPTQFEKNTPGGNTLHGDVAKGFAEPSMTSGMGAAAVGTVKKMGSGLLDMLNPTTSTLAHPSEMPIVQAAKEAKAGWDRGGAPGRFDTLSRVGEAATSGLGSLVGMSGKSAAEHAAKGESGAILGEAAVPAVAAVAGYAGPKIWKASAPIRTSLAEKSVAPLVSEGVGETAADRRMGVIPEKGITQEGHIGTREGLVEKTQVRTAELKKAADNILQNHQNAGVHIDANPLIDQAVDNAVKEARKVGAPTERLEAIRKALKTEFGKVAGRPIEMNDLKSKIQEAANGLGAYKNTQPVEASAAAAMKDAARLIKEKVNALVPEAAELNERMANSIDAQAGLQKGVDAARSKSMFGGFHEGMSSRLMNRTLGSAPVRSGLARILMAGQTEGVPSPIRATPFAPKGLLGEGKKPAVPAGWEAADTSGAIKGGRWTNPVGALPEPQPIEAEFVPRRVPTGPSRVGVNRMLPSGQPDIHAGPPAVEWKFAREEVGTPNNQVLAGRKGVIRPQANPEVRGLLPAEAGQRPEAPQRIGVKQVSGYKPSEKAATMSAPARSLGPEFEADQMAHERARNESILRNPKATAEDRRIAQSRLDEMNEPEPVLAGERTTSSARGAQRATRQRAERIRQARRE